MHKQRLAKKNKQLMKYAKYLGKQPGYEIRDGEIVTMTIDGVEVPVKTGSPVKTYSEPVEFKACISSTLNKLQAEAWGVSQSNIYSQIVCEKEQIPLEIGDKVWLHKKVKMLPTLTTDPSSADYTVVGYMNESLYCDWFLLQRNDVSEDEND